MKYKPFRIEGDIAYIPLTRGYEAIIDAADVELVGMKNWYALPAPGTVYARREVRRDGKKIRIPMHRVITQPPTGMEVDHIDGNGLNNRRSNLRVVTHAQNLSNRGAPKNNTSGKKGVVWMKDEKRWRAQIGVNGKNMHIGCYPTIDLAHAAYVVVCRELHGEFGRPE